MTRDRRDAEWVGVGSEAHLFLTASEDTAVRASLERAGGQSARYDQNGLTPPPGYERLPELRPPRSRPTPAPPADLDAVRELVARHRAALDGLSDDGRPPPQRPGRPRARQSDDLGRGPPLAPVEEVRGLAPEGSSGGERDDAGGDPGRRQRGGEPR